MAATAWPRVATASSRTGGAVLVVLVPIAAVLLSLPLLRVVGLRPLTVLSGSMAPAIHAGDLVVTRPVSPGIVTVGQIVTFADPLKPGRLITHRAIEITHQQHRVGFVTQGDANTGVERWSVDLDGAVGVHVLTIPNAGFAVHWLGRPELRVTLLTLAVVILTTGVMRRIWRSR